MFKFFKRKVYNFKKHLTADEFILAIEYDFGRELDVNSKFLFWHLESTPIWAKMGLGKLKIGEDEKLYGIIFKSLLIDLFPYALMGPTPNVEKPWASDQILNAKDPIAEAIYIMQDTYPDASNIMVSAYASYLNIDIKNIRQTK